jgi:hypothetical protein
MKTAEIQVGHTYINRGAGKTCRTVIAIGPGIGSLWLVEREGAPEKIGVQYTQPTSQGVRTGRLTLSSFARWAGREVSG